jgi:ectoine hydroxylase-related dioxygenase (phytanoyl-CoA dioxygenase family)
MEIGDWNATRGLNESYRAIRAMGLETHVAEFDAFGLTVIEGAASPKLVERLQTAICSEVERQTGTRPDVVNGKATIQGMQYRNHLLNKDPAFEEALMLERPLALAKYLLGESCIFSTMGSHFRGDGGDELPQHSDMIGWMPAPFPHYVMFVNYTLAVTDYTLESGAVAVMPGSHRKGRGPERSESAFAGNKNAVPVEAPAGSAIIWYRNLWHGGCVRSIPGYRMNLATVFLRPGLTPQEDYRGAIPQETFDRNGEAFARLLGRDVPWMFSEEEGPDYGKIAKQAIPNSSWHS